MLIALWSAKGGAGTTVATLLGARHHVRRADSPVLAVDLDGDLPTAAGLTDVDGPGLAEWTRVGPEVRPDALDRLIRPVSPGLRLLPRGAGAVDRERLGVLGQLLAARPGTTLADLGRLPPDRAGVGDVLLAAADRSILVTPCCYVALCRGVRATRLPRRVDGVMVRHEPGRSLAARDVAATLGAPVVAELATDPAIARLVDAGLLLRRPGRAVDAALAGALVP